MASGFVKTPVSSTTFPPLVLSTTSRGRFSPLHITSDRAPQTVVCLMFVNCALRGTLSHSGIRIFCTLFSKAVVLYLEPNIQPQWPMN